MSQQHPSLRFDHREIAVIFSLFIFVSLLMFTVGILVGKGLSQAKYEGVPLSTPRTTQAPEPAPAETTAEAPKGNSVTSGSELSATLGAPAQEAPGVEAAVEPKSEAKSEAGPLQLTPQRTAVDTNRPGSLLEPSKRNEADHILKNPRIQALVEDDNKIKRVPSSIGNIPESFANGKYSVQVGSYSTEREAKDRVEALKKLGFPYANFSAKQLPSGATVKTGEGSDKGETWYRVWLGSYPDYESANESGRKLQERGEVKHYLVRKADTAG
jgi:hypothetical protein